jgi:hypothetical protein
MIIWLSKFICYILIIPGFGMVSHIVSTFSGKPIFGQDGPKYLWNILKQTICGKISYFYKQNTILISHNFYLLWIISIFWIGKVECAGISAYFYLIVVVITTLLVMVKIFVYSYNPQITKARISSIYKSNILNFNGLSMWVGISEAIRLLFLNYFFPSPIICRWKGASLSNEKHIYLRYIKYPLNKIDCLVNKRYYSNISINNFNTRSNENTFNQWVAGLIDGDGCFIITKKGYASLEIVMETRDMHCLYQIKQKFGGSVKLRSGVQRLRYRLHHKKGLLDLIHAVNGEIRNPVRLLQLKKICDKYDITLIYPSALTYYNGWLSGFFDSDGSVYLNLASSQLFITASQKNKSILEPLMDLYGGTIYIQKESFKWVVYKKLEIIKLLDYFNICPSRSAKHNRLKAIKRYLELRDLKAHLASPFSILGKIWTKFLVRWEKWEKV